PPARSTTSSGSRMRSTHASTATRAVSGTGRRSGSSLTAGTSGPLSSGTRTTTSGAAAAGRSSGPRRRRPAANRPVRKGQYGCPVRLLVARCEVRYSGRLKAVLPEAVRLLILKADGSVLVHDDAGGYKPLNWMSGSTF